MSNDARRRHTFDQAAAEEPRGLLSQLCGFMAENAKWWLAPFAVVFGLLGFALALGATGAAPFIYTMW
jgi:hypothetical protein